MFQYINGVHTITVWFTHFKVSSCSTPRCCNNQLRARAPCYKAASSLVPSPVAYCSHESTRFSCCLPSVRRHRRYYAGAQRVEKLLSGSDDFSRIETRRKLRSNIIIKPRTVTDDVTSAAPDEHRTVIRKTLVER